MLLLLWLAVISFVGHDKNVRIEKEVVKQQSRDCQERKRTYNIKCHLPTTPKPKLTCPRLPRVCRAVLALTMFIFVVRISLADFCTFWRLMIRAQMGCAHCVDGVSAVCR